MNGETEALQSQVQELTQQLQERDAQFGVLKQTVVDLEAKTSQADASLKTANDTADAMSKAVATAVPEMKRLILANNPHIPPSMLEGNTPDEVMASAIKAHETVKSIKETLDKELSDVPIPAGAPSRTGEVDKSQMTGLQKIISGLRTAKSTGNQGAMPQP